MTPGLDCNEEQAVWILDYLLARAIYLGLESWDQGPPVGVATSYDPEYAFITKFHEKFPGEYATGYHRATSRRVRRILNQLLADGLVEKLVARRERVGSGSKTYHVWIYAYRVSVRTLRVVKRGYGTSKGIVHSHMNLKGW